MPVTSGCSVSLSGRCIRSVKNRGQVSAATKFSRRSNFPFSRPIHLSLTCVLQQIDKNGERLRDPEAAPASVCSLLQRCWLGNPAERPRFADISLELSKSTPLMVRCRTLKTFPPPVAAPSDTARPPPSPASHRLASRALARPLALTCARALELALEFLRGMCA